MLKAKQATLRFPPLLIIGAIAVLTPIFIFLTVQALNRQRDNVTKLMVEKGAALIRSFEAGARTGMMMKMGANGYRVQRLLTETAQQPDIVFLLVTDQQGVVLAHNELEKVGLHYGKDLDLQDLQFTFSDNCLAPSFLLPFCERIIKDKIMNN